MGIISTLHKKISDNVSKVIVGKQNIIDLCFISLIAKGHMLLEDVPGSGKTKFVKAFAKSIASKAGRIQFTPDLLPSDITGIRYFNMKTSDFEFVPGPVFSNILLADEINRATPKTQSGLLECMEEGQATVDGISYALKPPFMVIATQNPVESMGVFPLPEAQLDRFLFKSSMGYPSFDEGVEILRRFSSRDPLEDITPVSDSTEIEQACRELDNVFVHTDISRYIINIVEATRTAPGVALGISPRGALALQRASMGFAAINGRDFVIPDDIKKSALPVLCHRLILQGGTRVKEGAAKKIINDIISSVAVPTEDRIFRQGK